MHSYTVLLGGAELRTSTPILFSSILCSRACSLLIPVGKVVLNTAAPIILPSKNGWNGEIFKVVSNIPTSDYWAYGYHRNKNTSSAAKLATLMDFCYKLPFMCIYFLPTPIYFIPDKNKEI